jgi:hypothetical protein
MHEVAETRGRTERIHRYIILVGSGHRDDQRRSARCPILSEIAIFVRRDSAVKLVDGLAGESPASADYPVGTVVISGDGAGDQTVESPDVNVLVGWTQVRSAPTGGQAKQQVVAKANRSQASKTHTSQESECEVRRECRNFYPTLKASVFGEVLGKGSRRVPRGLRGRQVVKEHR